jgi:hypothetical protein
VTDEPQPGPALPPPPPARLPAAAPPGGHATTAVPSSRGWRTTLAVALTMLVVVIGVNVADASVPLPDDPRAIDDPAIPGASFPVEPGAPEETLTPIDRGPVGQGDRLDVGLGASIVAPAGWSLVSQDDSVTVLQKGAALLVLAAIPTEDSPEELATWYRDAWFADGGYTGGDAEPRTIGDGLAGAQLDYTGAFQGAAVDGRIVAASQDGIGLLVNALAPTGSLAEVAPDLEAILRSVRLEGR